MNKEGQKLRIPHDMCTVVSVEFTTSVIHFLFRVPAIIDVWKTTSAQANYQMLAIIMVKFLV